MSINPNALRWSHDRIARLGFLLGRGWDVNRIAADPLVASTAKSVYRHAQRFGLAFRDTTALRLPDEAADRVDKAAVRRGLNRDGLIRLLVIAAASDPVLIDNILDDGR